jgi:hypothetical protein
LKAGFEREIFGTDFWYCAAFLDGNNPKADFPPGNAIFGHKAIFTNDHESVSTHLVPDNEMKGKTARTTFI